MSLGTITIQIPFRACQWVKWLALRQKTTTHKILLDMVLRQLAVTPGVDLSRAPDNFSRGCDDGESRKERG